MHRPQLQQLMEYVREGDTVVCHAMDCLARNLDDLRKIVLGLTERGVHVRFEKENLTHWGGLTHVAFVAERHGCICPV